MYIQVEANVGFPHGYSSLEKVRYYAYSDSVHMLYYTYIIFGQCCDRMRTKCMLLIINHGTNRPQVKRVLRVLVCACRRYEH